MEERMQQKAILISFRIIFIIVVSFGSFVFNYNHAYCDWMPEERLSREIHISSTTSSNQCSVAVEDSGNIHVVWLDDRNDPGLSGEVYYKKYTPLTGWGLEIRLTFEVMDMEEGKPIILSHNKTTPGIVADSSGNLYVSFENTETQTACVLRYDAVLGWGLTTILGDGGISDINPVLVVDSSNNVHAVWRGIDGGRSQIFYRKHTIAGGWGSTERLTSSDSEKQTPTLTVDSSGNIHVVWSDNVDDPLNSEIYYKKRSASGGWRSTERRSFDISSDSLKPYITSASSDDLHLVWEDNRDGNFEIYYLLWSESSGSWGSEERLTNEPFSSRNPHLAVDPSGEVHLTWQDGDHFSLYYKKKTALWSENIRLTRKGINGSITADAESNLHLVYSAQYEFFEDIPVGNPEIYYLKYDPTVISSSLPKEMVLALDISGSMGWKDDGTMPDFPSQTRLYRAGQALSNFLDRFNLRNPADTRFGLVTFPHSSRVCPSAENLTPGITPLVPLNETTRLNVITHIIPALTADGSTPLIEGLNLARGLFGVGTYNKLTLLISDGYHNCPNRSFPDDYLDGFIDSTDPVFIYTVGIGTAREVDLPRLEDMAAATGGEFRDATTTSHLDMMSWFKTIIQSLLSLEAECDPAGKIGVNQKIKHEVWVTDYDTDITFDLSWSTPEPGCIDFILHTPEGRFITAGNVDSMTGITHISRETYQLFYLKEEYLKSIKRAGKWIIELTGKKVSQNSTEPYQYSVLMDSSLKIIPEFTRKICYTGEPIGLQVVVLEGKKRLPARVRLIVYSPEQGMGNWLAKNKVNKGIIKKKQPKGNDPLTKHLLKARILAKDFQKPFPDKKTKTSFILYDDGTHGDLTSGDGIYATVFTNTKIPGTYVFDLIAEGKTSSGQRFRREKIIQRFLKVNVKEEFTDIKINKITLGPDGKPGYGVTITPKDALGNYLGPGYSDRISFFVKGARFITPVQDNLDGSYFQEFYLPVSLKNKPKMIKVRVLGLEMFFCF
jgi:hypothetical protein